MNKIRVVLAEDHHVVRAAVATYLTKEADIEVIGEVAEGNMLLDTVKRLKPDILLLDAHMPGHKVIESAQTLRKEHPDVRILVLSAYHRREYVLSLIHAGAAGYILKDDSPQMLVQAVRAVAQGEEWFSPQLAEIVLLTRKNKEVHADLTKRELQVLHLMVNGLDNDHIAQKLVISRQTVKNHIRHIYSKLGVHSRVDAVLYAINHGLREKEFLFL